MRVNHVAHNKTFALFRIIRMENPDLAAKMDYGQGCVENFENYQFGALTSAIKEFEDVFKSIKHDIQDCGQKLKQDIQDCRQILQDGTQELKQDIQDCIKCIRQVNSESGPLQSNEKNLAQPRKYVQYESQSVSVKQLEIKK